MSHPTKYFVQHHFREAELREEDPNYTALDAEIAGIQASLLQTNERLRAISTANGTLKYDLVNRQTFTATSGQTVFTLITPYNTTDDRIVAFTNAGSGNMLRIPSASISNTSSTTVTLPAQTLGATVEIEVSSPGNGNTALAATTAGNGASLIGIYDAGGLFASDTVEDALAEAMAALNSYISSVGSLSGYILADGTFPFTGDQSLDGNKLTDLGEATDAGDAVRFDQISDLLGLIGGLSATYLALVGGTMSGEIAMSSNKITGLAAATNAGDALRFEQALRLVGGTMSGAIAMGGNKITGLGAATTDGDAVRYEDLADLVPAVVTFPLSNIIVYASGTTSFTVPAGVTSVLIEGWGGGGTGHLGSGGGGGAYAKKLVTVNPADVLSVVVGAGGAANVVADPSPSGAASVVTNTTAAIEIFRAGGGAGASGTDETRAAGGTSAETVSSPGEPGHLPFTTAAGLKYFGGDGGMSPNGATGGKGSIRDTQLGTERTAGTAGNVPGGGGGGGLSGSGGGTHYKTGAAGRVILCY